MTCRLQSDREKHAALQALREQLNDAIDGGDECRGRDSQISRWIELCDIALGNPVNPWARLYHTPAIKEKLL